MSQMKGKNYPQKDTYLGSIHFAYAYFYNEYQYLFRHQFFSLKWPVFKWTGLTCISYTSFKTLFMIKSNIICISCKLKVCKFPQNSMDENCKGLRGTIRKCSLLTSWMIRLYGHPLTGNLNGDWWLVNGDLTWWHDMSATDSERWAQKTSPDTCYTFTEFLHFRLCSNM